MSYQGPQRRQHQVLVTQHSEYHLRGAIGIAVRDITTGAWKASHTALRSKLLGGVVPLANGSITFTIGPTVNIGSRRCFSSDVMTSRLKAISRPGTETVRSYGRAA